MVPVNGNAPFLTKILAVAIVEVSINSLKVINTLEFIATLVSLALGTVSVTVGRIISGATPVVNVHNVLLAKASPAKSLVPVVTVRQ